MKKVYTPYAHKIKNPRSKILGDLLLLAWASLGDADLATTAVCTVKHLDSVFLLFDRRKFYEAETALAASLLLDRKEDGNHITGWRKESLYIVFSHGVWKATNENACILWHNFALLLRRLPLHRHNVTVSNVACG
jgi:hypothetical protein